MSCWGTRNSQERRAMTFFPYWTAGGNSRSGNLIAELESEPFTRSGPGLFADCQFLRMIG